MDQYNQEMLSEEFDRILAQAIPLGDFLNTAQLFIDADDFQKLGMNLHHSALIQAAAELHHPDDSFIDEGVTTQTEVYFETYRRAFFDVLHGARLGSLEIVRDSAQREYVASTLYARIAEHAPYAGNPTTDKCIGKVVDISSRRKH
ncbi:TraG-like protein [Pseudomonas phage BHU-1]|nr:TraG-like protein [Pseudomonas phage BHU-1]UGV20003.1 TraG-like protein [Pseudomonas phage Pa BHU-15]UIW13563.1 TraG-like protein [Pseudomonas phage Pa BHU-17]